MDKNFSHCHGCGLCTLVCPAWQQTRDVCCTPQGHARALQVGGEVNVNALFDCILCGACVPVCPEDIDLMGMLFELRNKAVSSEQNSNPDQPSSQRHKGVLLLADDALSQQPALLDKITELLGTTGDVVVAQDSGSDIAAALRAGETIAEERMTAFLSSLKQPSRLIVSDGLLKERLQQWLPNSEIHSVGYALSSLSAVQNGLKEKDLYLIESQAYHSDFTKLVKHYDGLKRRSGCELNFDLQRLATATGGAHATAMRTATSFDPAVQGQWILRGLTVERIVVESVDDGRVMGQVTDIPVVHLAEIVASR